MTNKSAPISSPVRTAVSGRGPFAVLRRAKSVRNASEPEREALLEDAGRIETWAAWLVLSAIVLEAVTWAAPLCPLLFRLGNFIADAAVAIGIYGEMRFGHVVGDILKIRLADANERAAIAEREAGRAHERAAEIERITARRHVSWEQHWRIAASVSDIAAEIDLLLEFQRNDSEAYVYAYDLAAAFSEGGVKKIRIVANEFLSGRVFGLRISAAVAEWLPKIEEALSEKQIPRSVVVEERDLSKHLSRDQRAPNLYIFVAPKPPPEWEQPNPFTPEVIERLETANEEAAKLRAAHAWRRLTKEQTAILKQHLKGPPAYVLIRRLGTDPELESYAIQLREVFSASGWKTGEPLDDDPPIPGFFGLFVPPNNPFQRPLPTAFEAEKAALLRIQAALREAGVEYSAGKPKLPLVKHIMGDLAIDPQVEIFVGPKPLVDVGDA